MPLPMFQGKDNQSSQSTLNIIAVAAGKGGVGKSTVAVNLALALQLKGYAVGLMDTDIYGPSVRKMLPEDVLPSQKESIIEPAICRGIKMISMAYFRHESEAAVVRAPIANQIISQFLNNVDWSGLDYLIIDFPPGTGDVQLTLSQQAKLTGAILVTTPQDVALLDVRKAMNMFEIVKVPILGIIENMSGYYHEKTNEMLYLFGKGGGEKLAKENNIPFLGAVPIDPEISRRGDAGQSLFESGDKTAPGAEAFLNITDKILSLLPKNKSQNKSIPSCELSWKENDTTFTLKWKDGFNKIYRLNHLQANCPCAHCVDEVTGERLVGANQVKEDVRAKRIVSVGNYALRIDFTSGCSHGIYTLEMLRSLL